MSSTTTTTTVRSVHLSTVLTDYEIHHSSPQRVGSSADQLQSALAAYPTQRRPEWTHTSHRGVPSYRPINRARDLSEVRVYLNQVERAFVTVMFTGLFVNAVRHAWYFGLYQCYMNANDMIILDGS